MPLRQEDGQGQQRNQGERYFDPGWAEGLGYVLPLGRGQVPERDRQQHPHG